MDKRIDLTLNGDFSKGISVFNLSFGHTNLTEEEIITGFPIGSIDEIKSKRRILKIHHSTEGDSPTCYRCGKDLLLSDLMTCSKCNDGFELENLLNNIEYYRVNKIKNFDKEYSNIKVLFNIK